MYKPLPESLTIKPSGIHQLGLFADQDIKQGTNLGMTHVKLDDKIIRTPLGGFINHANDPNCTKVELHANGNEPYRKKWNLVTIQDIKQATNLGMTHLKVEDTIFRTPLGGFINHSNTPNCEKIELHANGEEPFKKKWNLITRQNIKKGEEITLRYTFYNI